MFAFHHAEWVYRHKKPVLACCLSASIVLISAGQLLSFEYGFLGSLTWIGAGLALCALRIYWLIYYNLSFNMRTELRIAASFVFGAAVFCAIALTHPPSQVLLPLFCGLVVGSMLLGVILTRDNPGEKPSLIYRSRQFSRFITSDILMLLLQGVVLGFTVVVVVIIGPEAVSLSALSVLVGCIVAIAITLMYKQRNYSLSLLLKRLLPAASVFFLFSSLLGQDVQLVCVCIIQGIIMYAQSRKVVLGVVLNNQLNLNPVTHHSLVPLPYLAGLFIGFFATVFAQQVLSFDSFALFVLAIAGSFIVLLVIFLQDFKNIQGRQGDTFSGLADYQHNEPAHNLTGAEAFEDFVNKLCDELVERFGLSRKESEILRYLVRGRNADYISNSLYISLSTAKTHIYHIYSKLGVNSHQQLLDVFESQKGRGSL
jgi:DNA-binding CsgD family transcriptional regulator